jgi:flagellar hook protein FlgE
MLRSLFSGITGLRAHQQMMDVTGNNIANVNTHGYKSAQALFEDTLSQQLRAAGAPQAGSGGSNAAQVGLGVRLAGIETNFEQGAAQVTGRSTDLMINGDGFFVVKHNGEQLFTRAGTFSFDADGRLVDQHGSAVQGWKAVNGVLNTNASPVEVRLPVGTLLPPKETTTAIVAGNLPADTTNIAPVVASIDTFDPQGNRLTLSVSFVKDPPIAPATTSTSWTATVTNGAGTPVVQQITFATDGSTPSPATLTVDNIAIDLSGITNYSGLTSVAVQNQNGSTVGTLSAFTISPDGTLVGVFSNGLKQPVAQVALAGFNNPAGLEKVGQSDYRSTANSGPALLGTPGGSGRGTLQGSALEMSNVDLALEFTNLVIAQRGFQANSKVIITSDELLQDLVNLKR